MRIRSLAAAVMLACSSVASLVWGAAYAPQVGTRHPDFTLPEITSGRPVALADYRGKKVLLIHFASW